MQHIYNGFLSANNINDDVSDKRLIRFCENNAGKLYSLNLDPKMSPKTIENEIKTAMAINHPTIAKFIAYNVKDLKNKHNILLFHEKAKNGTLYNLIQSIQESKIPLNYDNTNRQIILIGIARGMKYLHDRKIIHFDLTDDNVLLNENLHPLIANFGKLTVDPSLKQTNDTIKELTYKAPETIDKQIHDKRSNVYSFGIIMFKVLTELTPYKELEKISNKEFSDKIVNDDYRPQFEVQIKESFKKLIQMCWSKDPKERPTFKQILNMLIYNEEYYLDGIDIEKVKKYVSEITKINDDSFEELIQKIEELEKENSSIKQNDKSLASINDQLTAQIGQLNDKNDELNNKINQLTDKNNQYLSLLQQKDNKETFVEPIIIERKVELPQLSISTNQVLFNLNPKQLKKENQVEVKIEEKKPKMPVLSRTKDQQLFNLKPKQIKKETSDVKVIEETSEKTVFSISKKQQLFALAPKPIKKEPAKIKIVEKKPKMPPLSFSKDNILFNLVPKQIKKVQSEAKIIEKKVNLPVFSVSKEPHLFEETKAIQLSFVNDEQLFNAQPKPKIKKRMSRAYVYEKRFQRKLRISQKLIYERKPVKMDPKKQSLSPTSPKCKEKRDVKPKTTNLKFSHVSFFERKQPKSEPRPKSSIDTAAKQASSQKQSQHANTAQIDSKMDKMKLIDRSKSKSSFLSPSSTCSKSSITWRRLSILHARPPLRDAHKYYD